MKRLLRRLRRLLSLLPRCLRLPQRLPPQKPLLPLDHQKMWDRAFLREYLRNRTRIGPS